MRSPAARIGIGLAALAAVVVLFIVFTGGGDDNNDNASSVTTEAGQGTQAPKPEVAVEQQIVVRDGKPAGGIQKLEYSKGDRVKLIVTSDVADEIHVHGYDLIKDVRVGRSVRFSFPADIEGVFEIELEGRAQQIAQLKVSP